MICKSTEISAGHSGFLPVTLKARPSLGALFLFTTRSATSLCLGGRIVRMTIRRRVIETVRDDHRTLAWIVNPTVPGMMARVAGGRTVW